MPDITYQKEPWRLVEDEIIPLAKEHFVECDPTHGMAKFEFDRDGMLVLESNNMLHVTTARDGTRLVGYIVNLVMPRHLMFNKPFASHLGWYVLPGYRRKMVGMRLLEQAERLLQGVVELTLGMHTHTTDASKMFLRLGWEKSETNYMKWI